MSGENPHVEGHGPPHAHAPETASIRGLFIALGGLLVLLAGVFIIVYWVLGGLQKIRPGIPPYSATVSAAPPPMAAGWIAPPQTLDQLRDQETAHLDGYAWVDRRAGVVQIPIERAMQLLPQRATPQSWAVAATTTAPARQPFLTPASRSSAAPPAASNATRPGGPP